MPKTPGLRLRPAVLSGVNAANTTIIAAMHTLNTILTDIVDNHQCNTFATIDPIIEAAEMFQDDFGQCLVNIDCPEAYFRFIGNGAYKECYDTGIPGWVVKFCTTDNSTGAERQILQAAQEYGVAELFAPSHYLDLPVYLDSCFIEPDRCGYSGDSDTDWEARCKCENESMDVAILQPYCTTVAQRAYQVLLLDPERYDQFPVMLNSGQPLEMKHLEHLDITCLDWLQAIVEHYGDKMLFRFLRFTKNFRMVDLHEHNIGYYETAAGHELPVLLDWLSTDNA